MTEMTPMIETAEKPFAIIRGEPITALPRDLYIPPQALEILLEAFTGPLDLLLYLIKKQNFDILDIPIAEVTRQYLSYIALMKQLQLELAAEYLVMAATLAEIKSRLLLPKPVSAEGEELDPRAELIRRLQEYEQIKQAATTLDTLPQQGRDVFLVNASLPVTDFVKPLPQLDLMQLAEVFNEVLARAALRGHHHIQREVLSIRERMGDILSYISRNKTTQFSALLTRQEGRLGVVVTFIALLELLKQALIEMQQIEPFGPIHVSTRGEQWIANN